MSHVSQNRHMRVARLVCAVFFLVVVLLLLAANANASVATEVYGKIYGTENTAASYPRANGTQASHDSNPVIAATPNGLWHSSADMAQPVAVNGHNDLLAFRVNNILYSTGVDDAMLDANGVSYQAGRYRALLPANVTRNSSTYNGIPKSQQDVPGQRPSAGVQTPLLYDGIRGLNLGTAIFNIAAGEVRFTVNFNPDLVANASTSIPDLFVTQVGSPSSSALDSFYFVNSNGERVGDEVKAQFNSSEVRRVGRQTWAFFETTPAGGQTYLSGGGSGGNAAIRDLRMLTFNLRTDFKINQGNAAQIVAFVQKFSGDSDSAFVAYNEDLFRITSLSLESAVGMGPLVVGVPTHYTLTVRNTGTLANANVLTVTDTIPAGLTIGTLPNGCTLSAPQTVQCTIAAGSLSTNSPSASFAIPITPTQSLAGTSVTNQARVTGGANCANTSNLAAACSTTLTTPVAATPPPLLITLSGVTGTVDTGAPISYTVTITNQSTTTVADPVSWQNLVTNLSVQEILAVASTANPGSTFGTCSADGCSGIRLAAGSSLSYTVHATTLPGVQVIDQAILSGGQCTTDNRPPQCASSQTNPLHAPAALTIVKSHASTAALTHGSSTSYTVTLTNSGASAARGVSWSDLPSGLGITGISATNISANSNAGIAKANFAGFENITVAANSSISYTVSANVTAEAGNQARNTASLAGANCSSAVVEGCSSTVSHAVVSPALLQISKTNSAANLTYGTSTSYTVTLTNSGGTAATGIEWTDTPTGLTITAITAANVDTNSDAGTAKASFTGFSNITIAPNASISYTVNADVTGAVDSQASNSVSLAGANCTNAQVAGCTSTVSHWVVSPAQLQINKTNSAANLTHGTSTSYTVTLTNNGGTAATGVEWTDSPVGLNITAITAGAVDANSNVGTAKANFAGFGNITIAPNASISYTVNADVTGAVDSQATNTASLSGANCTSEDEEACASTVSHLVVSPAQLQISKTNSAANLTLGTSTSYTVTLTNNGGTAATGVEWTDTPSGLDITAITFVEPAAGSDAGTIKANFAGFENITIAPNASISYTVTADVTGAVDSQATNTASLSGANCTSEDEEACASTVSHLVVSPAQLQISKTNSAANLTFGTSTSYTVTLTNNGGTAATGIEWTDSPTGLSITAITAGEVDANSDAGTAKANFAGFENITIAPNASISYTVNADVTGAVDSQASNSVSLAGANCTNAQVAGCTSTVSHLVVSAAQLQISKTNSAVNLTFGTSTSYTVTLTNNGGTAATGVEWTDSPVGLIITAITLGAVDANSDAGTAKANFTGFENITIAPSASISYTVNADVTGAVDSQASNTASLIGGNCASEDDEGCASSVSHLVVSPAQLQITKTNSAENLTFGTSTSYTVTLTNTGGTAATGVEWTDTPSGLDITAITFVEPAAGSDAGTIKANFAGFENITIAPNASISYTVNADVTGAVDSQASNTASLAGANCTNAQVAGCTSTVSHLVVSAAQLQINKTNSAENLTFGTSTSYTVTLTNIGGTAATDVEWTDSPTGLSITAITAGEVDPNSDAGTAKANFAGFENITIAPNTSITYTVSADVTGAVDSQATNTASLSGANCTSEDEEACASTVSHLVVSPAQLQISKTNSAANLTLGTSTSYTVTLTNNGGTAATGVEWTDTPTGLSITAITAGEVDANSNAGTAKANFAGFENITIAPNASISYTVNADVTGAVDSQATNTASLSGANCTSDDEEACASTVSHLIVSAAQLQISKTNSAVNLTHGTSTSYSVTLTNNGGTAATGIEWTDTPSGLDITAITFVEPAAGSDAGTIKANFAGFENITIAPNASISYTVTADVTGAVDSQASNTASLIGAYCDLLDNQACSSTVSHWVVSAAQLHISNTNPSPSLTTGATTYYTVTITNTGGSHARDVDWAISDALGVSIESIVFAANRAPVLGDGECAATGCHSLTLAPGESLVFVVQAQVIGASGSVTSQTASLRSSDCNGSSCASKVDIPVLVVAPPQPIAPVPVPLDSRWMLAALALLLLAARQYLLPKRA